MGGSIRRRGKASFELKIELDRDHTGRRRRRFVSFKGTKKAAEIELARLIAEEAAGEGIDPTKETLAEFAARWDRDWLSLNVSPKSLERYRQMGNEAAAVARRTPRRALRPVVA
jgi:integrase